MPTQLPRPPIGSHVPTSGGLASGAFPAMQAVGGETLQVFVGNPRGWAHAAGNPAQDKEFRRLCEVHDVPAFVHAPYLVNLGSPTTATFERSVASVGHNLARGGAIGARGVVVHTGSCVDEGGYAAALRQIREGLLPILDGLPDDGPNLLLEPTAGQGRSLCAGVEDLPAYFEALDWHPRVGICLDTCHVFAAGAPLDARGGMTRTLDLLAELVGDDRLQLVHANDCKDVRGSAKDRHERVGQGHIGEAAFRSLLKHRMIRGARATATTPAQPAVPVVLETPEGPEDWADDIALLQRMRGR